MAVDKIGRYEILETLGKGAMGVVYLARDPLIDRRVALKTLRVDLDAEYAEEFRERFLREAKAAGRLNHPGIVTIHDVGEDSASGVVFIAMEFIEGRDLKEILAAGHRFRPSEVARIAYDVAQAMDYAHAMGVVHRDIKPANVILTQDGTAKITDFGVARLDSSNLTVEGQFIGTPNFMSPEQITGKKVDGRSDIFSLGVVLFTLLTGRRPFAGETMHEVTNKIVQEPSPIPSTVAPEIPPAFNPIVLKCLQKDPDGRFQTGSELAQVLAALARSLVEREPGDDAQTGVFQPDLETRFHPPHTPTDRSPSVETVAADAVADEDDEEQRPVLRDFTTPRLRSVRQPGPSIWQLLPLPAVFKTQVNPRWVRIIVLLWATLAFGSIALVATQRDNHVPVSPSGAAVENIHKAAHTLLDASRSLAADRVEDAKRSCAAVLDQSPSSPAARRLMADANRRLEEQRLGEETQQQVTTLVVEGREAYSKGRYQTAAERFEEALALDPENELAASFLDLARERQRRRAPTRTRPTQRPQTRPQTSTTRAAAPTPRPTPGTARITVYFNSPISVGTVTVTLDDSLLADIPFDFTKKNFLGVKSKGSGAVKRVLLAPSGSHTVGIQLRSARRGLVGSQRFTAQLAAGSDWTLRLDLPTADGDANFYLVRTSR